MRAFSRRDFPEEKPSGNLNSAWSAEWAVRSDECEWQLDEWNVPMDRKTDGIPEKQDCIC